MTYWIARWLIRSRILFSAGLNELGLASGYCWAFWGLEFQIGSSKGNTMWRLSFLPAIWARSRRKWTSVALRGNVLLLQKLLIGRESMLHLVPSYYRFQRLVKRCYYAQMEGSGFLLAGIFPWLRFFCFWGCGCGLGFGFDALSFWSSAVFVVFAFWVVASVLVVWLISISLLYH